MQTRCPQFMKSVILTILSLLIFGCANNKLVAPVKFDGKYGFIEKNGNWHLEPRFDSLGNFTNGLADTYKNGKAGLINTKGEQIIPNEFDFIGNISDKRILVLLNNKYNFSDRNGNFISNEYYEDAQDYSNGRASIKYSKNEKWGYIDKKGNLKIDTIYDYAYDFHNRKAEVAIKNQSFIINKNGKVIDTLKNDYVKTIKKLRLIGNSDRGTLGRINRSGDTIMKGIYTSFGYVQKDKFWFNKQGKYGLADTLGTILIKPIYDYLTYFSDNGLAMTKKGDKFGFINENGIVIIDFKFDKVRGFKNDLAGAMVNGKWGFIDKKGKFVIEPKFDRIEDEFKPLNSDSERMYEFDYE